MPGEFKKGCISPLSDLFQNLPNLLFQCRVCSVLRPAMWASLTSASSEGYLISSTILFALHRHHKGISESIAAQSFHFLLSNQEILVCPNLDPIAVAVPV